MMQNSKRDSQIHSAIMSLASTEPNVEIKSYAKAGKGLARVVIDVTHTKGSREDHSSISSAIAKKLHGKMTAVAGSFKSLDKSAYTERITGLVGVVHDVIAIDETKSLKGFRAMASNMFMDEEKDMWILRKTESGQVLVKSTGIDDDLSLANLLEGCASAGHRSSPEFRALSSVASGQALDVQGGDYIAFVDVSNTIRSGFVVATVEGEDGTDTDALVLQPGSTDPEEVNMGAVTSKYGTEDFPEAKFEDEEVVNHSVSAARGVVNPDVLVEYYRKIYSSNPAFFAEFEKRIRSHAWM